MTRAVAVATTVALIAGVTGCGVARVQNAARDQRTPILPNVPAPNPRIVIPRDNPPSPETWPRYHPRFSEHSCWAYPYPFPGRLPSSWWRYAPSPVATPRAHPLAPNVVVHRLLARLGDRRYVRAIKLAPAPRTIPLHSRVHYVGGRPPADALKAEIVIRRLNASHGHASPELIVRRKIAEYESEIVGRALRDDFCDAGGAPLVVWSSGRRGGGAGRLYALDQRFPNMSPAAYRKRVALVGRRFGFAVASLRLLRPRQIAPLLVVKTNRSRKAFAKDIPRIVELLNPTSAWLSDRGPTFEAFFFAVEDGRGPFWASWSSFRNEQTGDWWAANRCLYPYERGDLGATGVSRPAC